MKAAIFQGVGKIEAGEQPDPVIKEQTDAIVRVVLACVCGSDLWYYRGITPHPKGSIGHEFIGVVGDGAVGLSAVLSAKLLGAERIIAKIAVPRTAILAIILIA